MGDLVYLTPDCYVNPNNITFAQTSERPKGVRIDFVSGKYVVIPDLSITTLNQRIQENNR